ncbi:MAG: V4R domain-containing protein [Thermoplasmata archaeon]
MKPLHEAFKVDFDPERARVLIGDEPYIMIRSDSFHALHAVLMQVLGRGASSLLFSAGYDRGSKVVRFLRDHWDASSLEEIVQALSYLSSHLGRFSLESFSQGPDGEAVVTLRHSFEAFGYRDMKEPVCHYLRGIFTSFFEEVTGRKGLLCEETRCEAAGSEECEFVIGENPFLQADANAG